jgi:hypothetical protein
MFPLSLYSCHSCAAYAFFFEIYARLGGADFGILSSLMGSLSMSLTSPATLEHIEFNISFDGPGDNFFDHDGFYEDLRNADV